MHGTSDAGFEFRGLLPPPQSKQLEDLAICPGVDFSCPAESDGLSQLS